MSARHVHAVSADTITPELLELIVRHAEPNTPAAFYARRALAVPGVRFYRSECARIVNRITGALAS